MHLDILLYLNQYLEKPKYIIIKNERSTCLLVDMKILFYTPFVSK